MEKPNHESSPDVSDTTMTIEYLRARLLSERSVSRSAKQRADELADRVVEVEEQLNIISLQRKKAEKATSDVLAILETLGISENSEGCYSNSDQEFTHPQSSNDNHSIKNTNKSRSIDQLGLESHSFSHRNLSWKSSGLLHFERKSGSVSSRRHSSFLSNDSSTPKHRLGKSCRQIKRRELRFKVDESSKNESISDSQIVDDDSKLPRCNQKNQGQERSAEDTESICIRSPRKLIDSEHRKHEGDSEMERALERRAELICGYEAEENAQIEWEEKYKENNGSTPESVEPGNQSDVTKERDELKRQPECFWPSNKCATSEVKDARVVDEVCRILSNGVQPSSQAADGSKKYQNVDLELYNQTFHPEIAVPVNKANQLLEKPEGCSYSPPSPAIQQFSLSNYSSPSQTPANDNYHESGSSSTAPGKSRFASHEPSKELETVLEALQQAKLSLQHKLRKLPLSEDRVMGKAEEQCYISAMSWRLPTDLQPEANVCKITLDSRSLSSQMNYYHDYISSVAANDQVKANPQSSGTRLNITEGSTFDFSPNKKTSMSCNDQFKLNPHNGTPLSTVIGSNGQARDAYYDSGFTFPSSDLYISSVQPKNKPSYGGDPLIQGAYINRASSSSSGRRELNPLGESTWSSLIDNGEFVRSTYNGPSLNMSDPSHIRSNRSAVSPQLLSPEPYYNLESDISLFSHVGHSHRYTHPSVLDFNPPVPTFSGFPSFPPSPAATDNIRHVMYRIQHHGK